MPNEFSNQTNNEIIHTAIKAVTVLVKRGNKDLLGPLAGLNQFCEKLAQLSAKATDIAIRLERAEVDRPDT